MTVKDLIKILKTYPDHFMVVREEQGHYEPYYCLVDGTQNGHFDKDGGFLDPDEWKDMDGREVENNAVNIY